MALQVLEVLWAGRARAPKSRHAPLCRVRCEGCGDEYTTRGYPRDLARRASCTQCRAGRFWDRRRAAMARPGVPGMRCEEQATAETRTNYSETIPDAPLSERELAWLGQK